MNLWKKASSFLKDQNSIFFAKLARRTSFRNPDLETAIIRATSHDEFSVDYKNAQRVFSWVRTSPTSLSPLICALSARLEKTRYWVVALKGLMLMHGIYCCKIPALRRIGRLPFDLSDFVDGYSSSERTWEYNAFVRAYFAFLDQRSVYDASEDTKHDQNNANEASILLALQELQRSQVLLDMLMQIRPYSDGLDVVLILEAMDCIIIEIFDVYSRICNGVAGVLVQIYEANKAEGELALRILYKAALQAAELSSYFEFCRENGVLNASEFPKVEQIPDEDIQDLEQLINGVSSRRISETFQDENTVETMTKAGEDTQLTEEQDARSLLRTIVTENWVVFDDENAKYIDPFEASPGIPEFLCGYEDGFNNSRGFLQLNQYYNSLPRAFPIT
ncbi:hypothetical protein GIB67_005212 [Kingdonia uniflora]|uniref:ENTH domain-containing protein n=1 Tax=Kingdonia uniflora TaxID=39325 RepID=A0A7J7NNJ7_9MAGN|nr:hypothetical protein GIB67_005212 [Kingdonia uniflora]